MVHCRTEFEVIISGNLEAKEAAAESAIDFLNSHVKYTYIGTRSRVIEGQLLQLFHANRWSVERVHPCVFDFNQDVATLEAMTIADGSFVAYNSRLM